MQALSLRASATEFNPAELEISDLSDLLWAANGVNRPDEGKRTAPSAMNAQDIDLYVFMKTAVYLYDAKQHTLLKTTDGDYRNLVVGQQEFVAKAPVICVLVSDISRFRSGEESTKLTWAAMDAGIVSQNISLFCASVGMKTRPRASMDQEKLRELLKLKDTQHLMLNHPVSY
jgi:SagB-type dehydrogenase family enzyme